MVVPLFNIWRKWSGFCFKHEEEFMVCCWLADCYIQVELLNQCWSPKKLRGWCQPQDFNGSMHQMRGRMYIYIAILILINMIEVSYQVSVIEEDIFIYIIFFSNWSPFSKRNLLACTCVLNEECFLMGRGCILQSVPPHTHIQEFLCSGRWVMGSLAKHFQSISFCFWRFCCLWQIGSLGGSHSKELV